LSSSVETRARIAFTLVVILGAAAALAWYFFSSSRYASYEIRTTEPVSGLIADSPVEFHGVEVGKVKRVRLIDPHSVSILLSVSRDAPVTRATVATITSRGLAARGFTGYVYIDLENVGTDSRPLTASSASPEDPLASRFPRIPTGSSRAMSLDTTIVAVTRDVQRLTALVQTVLDPETITALKTSIDNLERVTQTLTTNSQKLDNMIRNGQRASANAERASRQIQPLLESTQSTVKALQTQVLPEAYDTLTNLHHLSVALQEVTADIERDPSVILRGKKEPVPAPGEKR
jgi:phospholipid/cholesterol/gamma-HCH transport system substrate-binding protein